MHVYAIYMHGTPYIYFIDYPPVWKMGPENSFNYPPVEFRELHRLPPSKFGRKTPSLQLPPRIQGTSSTTPLEIRLENSFPSTTPPPPSNSGKLHRLPPLEIRPENSFNSPLEFRELHRLPPSKFGRKTPSTTPPRIQGTSSTNYPPQNRAGKLLQLPPARIQGTSSTTPLEIGPENSFNYPPSNSRNFIDYPSLEIFQIRPPPPNSIPRSAHWYIVIFLLLTSKEKLFGPPTFFGLVTPLRQLHRTGTVTCKSLILDSLYLHPRRTPRLPEPLPTATTILILCIGSILK